MADWSAQIAAAARRWGVPAAILNSTMLRESGGLQSSIGRAGEIGLFQIKPGTAADLGINPYDAAQNIDGGAHYLAQQYQRFGNWRDALAAYNAGPNASAVKRAAAAANYADPILADANKYGAGGALNDLPTTGAMGADGVYTVTPQRNATTDSAGANLPNGGAKSRSDASAGGGSGTGGASLLSLIVSSPAVYIVALVLIVILAGIGLSGLSKG